MSWKADRRSTDRRRKKRRLRHETLETRAMLYHVTGLPWPETDLSFSMVPDGTRWHAWASSEGPSTLHNDLNELVDESVWQEYVAIAMQSWSNHSNLNFHQVVDDGSAFFERTAGQGDIRIGATDEGSADGWASGPLGGLGGDITLRSSSSLF